MVVDLQDELTEDLEQRHATLLLTNKRLIRCSAAAHRANAVSVALGDVQSIEVNRTEKNRQRLRAGLMLIGGGVLLALVSLFFLSSPISPLLMALSLILIGVAFTLSYTSGMTGVVIVTAGRKSIKCRMRSNALEDAVVLVQRFYEMRLGYDDHEIRPQDRAKENDHDLSELTPAGTRNSPR